MSLSTNTTYRVYVDKLGASNPSEFIGDAGELFYDPNVPTLKLSDGSTPGGLTIAGGGGGGGSGESYWTSGASGISTSSNVGIGTTNPQYKLHVVGAGTTALFVNGNARITGILSIGTNTITLDPTNNSVSIGTAITLNATTGTIEVQGSTVANPTGDANYSGIVTAAYFYGDGSNLTNVAGGGGGAFSYCCTSNITSTNLTSHPDITSASNNFFAGCNAGSSITTGCCNNFIGNKSGNYTTTGNYNNFFGNYAGHYNTEGCNNNFIGNCAGYCSGTGSDNNFLGTYAGVNSANGNHNNFIGKRSGQNNEGSYNNFFGYYAGINNEGSYNNFIGYYAGYSNTTGIENNFFGYRSGYQNTTGSSNIFIGDSSGYCNTTGYTNIFIGCGSGWGNTSGYYNNFFGYASGCCNDTGNFNNFFGVGAGEQNISGSYNNFFGRYSGYYNNTGCYNVNLGNRVGQSISASYRIIIGSGGQYSYFDSPDTTKDTQLAIGVRTDANPANYWLVGNENFNVGIGTTNPTSKLTVGGDVKVGFNTSQGVILTAPDGTQYRLVVNNSGALSTVAV